MIKSYLLSTYQSLIKQKLFAAINIVGLAISLAVCTLIFLYVDNEYSYDKHWNYSERMFVLSDNFKLNGQTSFKNSSTPYPVMPMLRQYFPNQIEKSARRLYRGEYFLIEENRFPGGVTLVDAEFTEIFDFELIAGSLQDTLASTGKIALTEDQALSYFGARQALGETISLQVDNLGLVEYQVSAVFKIPEGSTSVLSNLSSFSLLDELALPELAENLMSWQGFINVPCYILVRPNVDIESLNGQLDAFVNQYVEEPWRILKEDESTSDFHHYEFLKMSDIHFDSELQGHIAGDKTKVLIFSMIGILVLVIGSANFVILSTAKTEERRREVGVRKVLGATRRQLLIQFMGESILLCLIALVLSLFLVWVLSSFFSSLIAQGASLNIFTPVRLALLFIVAVLIGIFGGVYPALVLARFDAVKIFKPSVSPTLPQFFSLRNVLVCFQFMIATVLILSTLTLYSQLSFFKNRDLGFNPDELITIGINPSSEPPNLTPLLNGLRSLSSVEKVGTASMPANRQGPGTFTSSTYFKDQSATQGVDASSILWVGYEFFDTYEIPIIAGRSFNLALDPIFTPSDSTEELKDEPRPLSKVIINRVLSDALGFDSPEVAVGQLIYQELGSAEGIRFNPSEVIGVVENSHYQSLRENIKSESFLLSKIYINSIAIRYHPDSAKSIRDDVELIWRNINGDVPIITNFVSQNVDLEFEQEVNDGKLILTFSLLAIFVSCIGLYGLASFTVKNKVKEIGVRKVVGANSRTILILFILRFLKPVFIANLLAAPITLWAVLIWLQSFTEQMSYFLLLPLFLITFALTLIIACITVGGSTLKAARADPVISLRYE